MGWDIIRKKKFETRNLSGDEVITLQEWQNYVIEDIDLIWAEESPVAIAFLQEGHHWIKLERYKMSAYFELNKSGIGNLRFGFFKDHVSIDCERQTLKRVEKMWQVTKALNGYLFKNGTRFTEKKLEKLRDKYNKTGNKTPSSDLKK